MIWVGYKISHNKKFCCKGRRNKQVSKDKGIQMIVIGRNEPFPYLVEFHAPSGAGSDRPWGSGSWILVRISFLFRFEFVLDDEAVKADRKEAPVLGRANFFVLWKNMFIFRTILDYFFIWTNLSYLLKTILRSLPMRELRWTPPRHRRKWTSPESANSDRKSSRSRWRCRRATMPTVF